MNKLLRNLALTALVAAPAAAMALPAGSGTAADPYQIATAADLCDCWTLTKSGETVYFVQTADIDMSNVASADWHAFGGYDNTTYGCIVNYDGQDHVITNFTLTDGAYVAGTNNCYNGSIFGVISGTIKNLGIVNANIDSAQGSGILAGWVGHTAAKITEPSVIENVYVTGKVKTSYYGGGFMGTTQQDAPKVILNNCFANVEVTGTGSSRQIGGIAGRALGEIEMNNVYVAGTLATANVAGSGLVIGGGGAAITANNVAAFNTSTDVTAVSASPVTGTIATDATIATVQGWAGFSKYNTVKGYPALAYTMQGEGTEAAPYIVDCVRALSECWTLTKSGETVYFTQTADVDMKSVLSEDWHPFGGFDNVKYGCIVNYDGQENVIKNFTLKDGAYVAGKNNCYNGSIFGVISGTIKNLGIVNANIDSAQGSGILAGWVGHTAAKITEPSVIENVYVTGKVKTSYYGGGFMGTTQQDAPKVILNNCFANVEVTGTGSSRQIGGIAGRALGEIEMNNVYVAGTLATANVAGSGLVIGGGGATITAKNVIAFNTSSDVNASCASTLAEGSAIEFANTEATKAAGIAKVQKWAGFSPTELYEGYPALDPTSEGEIDEPLPTEALTLKWCTPVLANLQGTWCGGSFGANCDWTKSEGIMGVYAAAKGDLAGKPASNTRFATAKNGKIYTVNMSTMYIAEVTPEGEYNDLYKLAVPADTKEYYGTAISVDEAGNFLVGMNFLWGDTKEHASSNTWAVYNKKTGTTTRYEIEGLASYRLDCAGRILGDLTKEAYFYLAPTTAGNASLIKATPEKMEVVKTVAIGTSTAATFIQPAYNSLAAAGANYADFYTASDKGYHAAYVGGNLSENFAERYAYTVKSGHLGFDTFVVDGKRYFVRGYSDIAGQNQMGIVIFDENGDEYCHWKNEEYTNDGGFATIVAEPKANGTVNIYTFNPGNNRGAGAMLVFYPALAGEPFSNKPKGTSVDDPIVIKTAEDLQNLTKSIGSNPSYIEFAADIDLKDVNFTAINSANTLYVDGKNHVVKNLSIVDNYASLFQNFTGEIKNLGVEDVYLVSTNQWATAGAFIGYAVGNATVDNCYATGTVSGYYAGGLVAGSKGALTIQNSYFTGVVSTTEGRAAHNNGFAGGLVGPCNRPNSIVIKNSYVAAEVSGVTTAGGVAAGANCWESSGNYGTITLENVVAWNTSVTCPTASRTGEFIGDKATATYTATDCAVWDNTTINGAHPESGKTMTELQTIVTGWEAFNDKLNQAYPVLAWQEADGVSEFIIYGTEEHPYEIATAEDVIGIGAKTAEKTYFTVVNDIDMTGVAFSPIKLAATSNAIIEGNGHVIKGLKYIASSAMPVAMFDTFTGEISNLGLEDVEFYSNWGCGGAFAGYTGHNATAKFTNCYATGKISSAAVGGFVGANNGTLIIDNCYNTVSVNDISSHFAGGFVGRIDGKLYINNSFFAGEIVGKGPAAGIGVLRNQYAGADTGWAAVKNDATVDVKNFANWATSMSGSAVEDYIYINSTASDITPVMEGLSIWNGIDEENGVSTHHMQGEVLSWGVFHKNLHNGYPVLAWQEANGEGLEGAEIYISESADELGEAFDGTEYTLEGKTVYVHFVAHKHFTVKHKFTAAVSTLAADANDGYGEYSEPIAITTLGTLKHYITDANGNATVEAAIQFTGESGINDITVDEAEDAVYYNLHGVRVANPENGVYVRVAGGKATKVVK